MCEASAAADFTECKATTGRTGLCSEGVCARLIAIRSGLTENARTPYISATLGQSGGILQARAASIGPWETFLQIPRGLGSAWRSYDTKRFVTLMTVGTDRYLFATGGTTSSSGEVFSGGSGSIQYGFVNLQCGPNNGKVEDAQLRLDPDGGSLTSWESLSIVDAPVPR